MSDSPFGQGRRRRPAAQTRERLLAVAVERVTTEGLVVDFPNLGLEDLIRAADVPRSTVFRLWRNKEDFVGDVVLALFRSGPDGDGVDSATFDALTTLLEENRGELETAAGRRRLLLRSTRVGVALNVEAVTGMVAWRIYRAAFAATNRISDQQDHDRLRERLCQIEDAFLDTMARTYARQFEQFGLRLRPGLSARDFASAAAALVEGIVNRRELLGRAVDEPRSLTVETESSEEWSVSSIALLGLVDAFTEELPEGPEPSLLGSFNSD